MYGREINAMKNFLVLLVLSLIVATGCGKREGTLADQAGTKMGETLTDFASGVGKGVDKQMMVNVELSKTLTDQGISHTVAKSLGINPSNTKGISVYLIASKALKSKLITKALAKDGQEIGRSVVEADLAADDAKYVTFEFDREMDTQLVDKYTIDVKK
jgi:hypothetical protein